MSLFNIKICSLAHSPIQTISLNDDAVIAKDRGLLAGTLYAMFPIMAQKGSWFSYGKGDGTL
jgi:hypothetical protein